MHGKPSAWDSGVPQAVLRTQASGLAAPVRLPVPTGGAKRLSSMWAFRVRPPNRFSGHEPDQPGERRPDGGVATDAQ